MNKLLIAYFLFPLIVVSFSLPIFSYGELDFRPYDVGYRDAFVCSIEEMGEYQFVLALNRNTLYAKKSTETQWQVVKNSFPGVDRVTSVKAFGLRLYVGDTAYFTHVSTNNGESWSSVADTIAVKNTQYLDTSIFSLLTQGFQGIKQSSDYGKTWKTIFAANEQLFTLAKGKTNLYCGAWGKFYVSENSGESWDTLSTGLPEKTAVTAILEVDDTTIFAGTDKGLYYSINAGTQWSLLSDEYTKLKENSIDTFVLARNRHAFFLTQPGKLYQIDCNSFQIEEVSHTANNSDAIMTISSIDSTLHASGSDGVYTYEDSIWSRVGSSLDGVTLIDTLYQTKSFNFLQLFTPDNKSILLKNTTHSDAWTPVLVTDAPICSVIPTDTYVRVVTKNVGGKDLYISSTGGASWTEQMTIDDESPLPNDKTGRTLVHDNQILFHDGINLYKSLDQGKNWTHKTKYIFDEIVNIDSEVVAVETVPGGDGDKKYIWYSGDFGENFHRVVDSSSINTSRLRVREGVVYGIKDDQLNISHSTGQRWDLFMSGEKIRSIDYASRSLVIVSKLLGNEYYHFRDEYDYWYELSPVGSGGSTSFYPFGEFLLAIENETVFKAREGSNVSSLKLSSAETSNLTTIVNQKQLTLSCGGVNRDITKVQLLSPTGRLLIEKDVTRSDLGEVTLDRSSIASGLYIIAVKGDSRSTFSVVHLP